MKYLHKFEDLTIENTGLQLLCVNNRFRMTFHTFNDNLLPLLTIGNKYELFHIEGLTKDEKQYHIIDDSKQRKFIYKFTENDYGRRDQTLLTTDKTLEDYKRRLKEEQFDL